MESLRRPQSAGFSLLELLMVIAIIGIVTSLAVPSLLESKKSANESSAISAVRTLVTAQTTYSSTSSGGRFAPDLTTLISTGLVDDGFSGTRNGYNFSVNGTAGSSFTVNADPSGSEAGERHFFSDESGTIRVSLSGPANAASTILNTG